MAIMLSNDNTTNRNTAKPIQKAAPVLKVKDLIVRSRFIRNTPDKLRFVGKILVGMNLLKAIEKLEFVPKAAARELQLVLKNGLSIAKDKNLAEKNLYIKSIAVLEGPKLKRRRIVHRGRATSILKRMSHLTIILSDKIKKDSGVKNGT